MSAIISNRASFLTSFRKLVDRNYVAADHVATSTLLDTILDDALLRYSNEHPLASISDNNITISGRYAILPDDFLGDTEWNEQVMLYLIRGLDPSILDRDQGTGYPSPYPYPTSADLLPRWTSLYNPGARVISKPITRDVVRMTRPKTSQLSIDGVMHTVLVLPIAYGERSYTVRYDALHRMTDEDEEAETIDENTVPLKHYPALRQIMRGLTLQSREFLALNANEVNNNESRDWEKLSTQGESLINQALLSIRGR